MSDTEVIAQKVFEAMIKTKEWNGHEILWQEEALSQGSLPQVQRNRVSGIPGDVVYPFEYYVQFDVDPDVDVEEIVRLFKIGLDVNIKNARSTSIEQKRCLENTTKIYATHRGVNCIPNGSNVFVSALISTHFD